MVSTFFYGTHVDFFIFNSPIFPRFNKNARNPVFRGFFKIQERAIVANSSLPRYLSCTAPLRGSGRITQSKQGLTSRGQEDSWFRLPYPPKVKVAQPPTPRNSPSFWRQTPHFLEGIWQPPDHENPLPMGKTKG